MTDRVAVYIDFDNVVISRYDNLHGDGAWRKDEARHHRPDPTSADPVDVKLAAGRGRPRRDHRLRRVVRGRRDDPGVRRLVGARERRLQARRSSTARSTWSSCSPRPAPRTAPTSGSPSTPSRTCPATATSPTSPSSPATPTTCRSPSAASGWAGSWSASASPARPAGRWSTPATSSRATRPCPGVSPQPAPAAGRGRQEGHRDGPQVVGEEVRGQEDDRPGAGRARRAGRVRRARRADRGDGPAGPRGPGGPAEERRRVGAQLEREEPDAADGSGVQGEGAGLHLVPRLRRVARRHPRDQAARERPAARRCLK